MEAFYQSGTCTVCNIGMQKKMKYSTHLFFFFTWYLNLPDIRDREHWSRESVFRAIAGFSQGQGALQLSVIIVKTLQELWKRCVDVRDKKIWMKLNAQRYFDWCFIPLSFVVIFFLFVLMCHLLLCNLDVRLVPQNAWYISVEPFFSNTPLDVH